MVILIFAEQVDIKSLIITKLTGGKIILFIVFDALKNEIRNGEKKQYLFSFKYLTSCPINTTVITIAWWRRSQLRIAYLGGGQRLGYVTINVDDLSMIWHTIGIELRSRNWNSTSSTQMWNLVISRKISLVYFQKKYFRYKRKYKKFYLRN